MTWGKFGLASTLLLVTTVALVATVLTRGPSPVSAAAVLDEAICTNGTVISDHATLDDPNDDSDDPNLVTDCKALVAVANEWNGQSNMRRYLTWGGTESLSDWEGITVEGNRVTKVVFDNTTHTIGRFVGNIPDEIGDLTALKVLVLSRHQLAK